MSAGTAKPRDSGAKTGTDEARDAARATTRDTERDGGRANTRPDKGRRHLGLAGAALRSVALGPSYELTAEILEVDDDGGSSLYEASLHGGWGDGAPVLPATDEYVHALLAATPYRGDRVLGALPPRFGLATVELVAINAALAGVEPRAFPYVVAALEALLVPEWNAAELTTATPDACPIVIVNGPARDAYGIDYRAGCLGGAAGRGSMTIGRAVALCLRNIGGRRPGETPYTVFGQPTRFGLCFGEYEGYAPWPSLAERRGFASHAEVVTVHGGQGVFPFADIAADDPQELARAIAKTTVGALAERFVEPAGERGQIVLLLNPEWAWRLGAAFRSAEDFQARVWQHAWRPIDAFDPAHAEVLGAEGRVDARGRVPLAAGPDQFVPVVCGGLGNLHGAALTTSVPSAMQSTAVVR
ncbi:hypothetical protein LO772_25955 [Yinghuangia sp. ASG 101]|uniref:hypothetical protein n=1 Tax=Yinghuangia sp. ASG 101 TaxID=2896848 RepID=UPI001E499393|nr:hypothetical protein [Yinghuangia sp. ASG 101]UGQ10287.1 hypothetical protein LO772_25955 [Yinghuangia sp. ASG 101]